MPSLSTANSQPTFTYELTNGSFTIGVEDGISKVSVFNGTATSGSVSGDRVVNGISGSLTIAENETVTIVSDNGRVLIGITITAPAACTLKIICN